MRARAFQAEPACSVPRLPLRWPQNPIRCLPTHVETPGVDDFFAAVEIADRRKEEQLRDGLSPSCVLAVQGIHVDARGAPRGRRRHRHFSCCRCVSPSPLGLGAPLRCRPRLARPRAVAHGFVLPAVRGGKKGDALAVRCGAHTSCGEGRPQRGCAVPPRKRGGRMDGEREVQES